MRGIGIGPERALFCLNESKITSQLP